MSDLDQRVRRLQRLADPQRRAADATRRECRRSLDRRVAVFLRFCQAVPPERDEAVATAIHPHLTAILRPREDKAFATAPAIARLIRAFGDSLRKLRFPDPQPVAWLDLYLDHPAAEEVVTTKCPRCGLVHPSYADYTEPAGVRWKSSDGTTRISPGGRWYQTYPLAPDWRCVVCRGLLQSHGDAKWNTSMGAALLSNGGRLKWRRDESTGEKVPYLVPADPDPCSEFTAPDTLELAR